MTDIIVVFTSVSVILGICMFLHFRLYNEQQRKLNEQNEILATANRSKTEFFANISHEMRTPLTVISVNVQTVTDILDELSLKDEEAGELLQSAQSEIMRLARMVGGMLTLASMTEISDRRVTDLSSLLQNGAEMLRLNFSRRGNEIETRIEKGLIVFGNADLLAQVLINLLQNAGAHMENGTATVSAARDGGTVTVSIRANRAFIGGTDMLLTQKEFVILLLLAENEGRLVTTNHIYETIWKQSPDTSTSGAVKTVVSRLRRKLSEEFIVENDREMDGYILTSLARRPGC